MLSPKNKILGCEFAGIVAEVGSEVKSFARGEAVFGFNAKTFGAHAEYLAVPEDSPVLKMPAKATFAEAASLTEGAHYALADVRAAKISAGQNVLVYGATGAIGSAAVQLLKYYGASVTAVCKGKDADIVRTLGADVVIDYTQQDFTKSTARYDFILDAVGKTSFALCKRILSDKGIYISTEPGRNGQNLWLALFSGFGGGKRVRFPIPVISREELKFFSDLYDKGQFKPLMDRTFKIDQIVEAYRYVETGQKTGNVTLVVAE